MAGFEAKQNPAWSPQYKAPPLSTLIYRKRDIFQASLSHESGAQAVSDQDNGVTESFSGSCKLLSCFPDTVAATRGEKLPAWRSDCIPGTGCSTLSSTGSTTSTVPGTSLQRRGLALFLIIIYISEGIKISAACSVPLGFHPLAGEIPWRRDWKSTPEHLPGKSHRLVGYSPWGGKESTWLPGQGLSLYISEWSKLSAKRSNRRVLTSSSLRVKCPMSAWRSCRRRTFVANPTELIGCLRVGMCKQLFCLLPVCLLDINCKNKVTR